MKNKLLGIAVIAALSATAAAAQSLVGAWQGTLNAGGKDLRLVFKIATTDADALKGTLHSIDQGGVALPASAVTLQGTTVKILIPAIGGTYQGKLSADRNSLEGTWTQGPAPLPLTLTRATAETAWAIPEPPPPVKKMAADADPVFEVAAIKLSKPDQQGQGLTIQGRRLVTRNTSLGYLMAFAYGMHPRQIIGGPAWLDSEKYDITAEPEQEGQPNDKQVRTMIRKLLEDRFKLVYRKEKRDLPAYVVTVAKTGAKLTASTGDPNGLPGLGFKGLGAMVVRNATIGDFANLMQTMVLDRPVVDQTGLNTRYDFTLNWTPEASQFGGRGGQAPNPAAAASDDAGATPDLFTAMVQQLGLKLEGTRTSVDVMVLERAEKPSEN